jgi:hypothetical protein
LVFFAGETTGAGIPRYTETQRDYLHIVFTDEGATVSSPGPAVAADSARQAALDWFFAPEMDAAEVFFPGVLLDNVRLFRDSPERAFGAVSDESDSAKEFVNALLDALVMPRRTFEQEGWSFERLSQGNIVGAYSNSRRGAQGVITLEKESSEGNVTVLEALLRPTDGEPSPVRIGMRRSDGTWKLHSLDYGPDYPRGRLDDPGFLSAFFGNIAENLSKGRVSANEANAIGNLRTMISAQVAYSSANRGFFDSPDCLIKPSSCIPGYPADGMAFLLSLIGPVHAGYTFTFHPGAPAPRSPDTSPSSMRTFAFVAVPLQFGETGRRSFCADDTGRICVTEDGSAPPVSHGRCAEPCRELQ